MIAGSMPFPDSTGIVAQRRKSTSRRKVGCLPIGLGLDLEQPDAPQRGVEVAQRNAQQTSCPVDQRVPSGAERLRVEPASNLLGRGGRGHIRTTRSLGAEATVTTSLCRAAVMIAS